MRLLNRVTGEWLEITDEMRRAARIARMRNRLYFAIQNVSRETLMSGGRLICIALTYRDFGQWRPLHISEWVRYMRETNGRQYAWVAELQDRGVIHYHYLTSLPDGERWDKHVYDFEWYHGFTFVTDCIRRPNYILKYMQKGGQKDGRKYPKGARICGYPSRLIYISFDEDRSRLASRMPSWLREGMDTAELEKDIYCFRAVGGKYYRRGIQAISPYTTYGTVDPLDVWQKITDLHDVPF